MQILVYFFATKLIDVPECPSVQNITELISKKYEISSDLFIIKFNGKNLNENKNNEIFLSALSTTQNIILRCSWLGAGLLGGKGGFGAALRAASKQKGKKRTTDFGSCRDLSGRRLRQVNDEIVMQKWMAAKEQGEEFDVDASTPSGISMWFLRTPNWADPFKEYVSFVDIC